MNVLSRFMRLRVVDKTYGIAFDQFHPVNIGCFRIGLHVFAATWRHIPRDLVTGAIIVISASDKSLPRWMICATDREREGSLALKMKHCCYHD